MRHEHVDSRSAPSAEPTRLSVVADLSGVQGLTELLDELEVLIRTNDPEELRQLSTPRLSGAAALVGLARTDLLATATLRIGDRRYRKAADALLNNPDTRFDNLTARSRTAANGFHVGLDAFRRIGRSGLSSRSKVLVEVARRILEIVGEADGPLRAEMGVEEARTEGVALLDDCDHDSAFKTKQRSGFAAGFCVATVLAFAVHRLVLVWLGRRPN